MWKASPGLFVGDGVGVFGQVDEVVVVVDVFALGVVQGGVGLGGLGAAVLGVPGQQLGLPVGDGVAAGGPAGGLVVVEEVVRVGLQGVRLAVVADLAEGGGSGSGRGGGGGVVALQGVLAVRLTALGVGRPVAVDLKLPAWKQYPGAAGEQALRDRLAAGIEEHRLDQNANLLVRQGGNLL